MTARVTVRRTLAGVALVVWVTVGSAASATADDLDINNLPAVSDATIAATVKDLRLQVSDIDLPQAQDLESTATDGAEQVVTLSSDILFAFDTATMPPAAAARIGTLVKDAPQGAKVAVGGHTDSLGTDARNRTLSQQRAATVAAAIRAARPDLVLTVKGFGAAQPVADNGSPAKDNPEGRAKNRRVEIRYAG